MTRNMHKLTESILPVILLLSSIVFVLIFVEYRASLDADRAYVIHITSETSQESAPEKESDELVEVDFSDDPRIIKAQDLIEQGLYAKAEDIYFSILANEPSAQIHNWLGTLYLKQKSYEKAVVSFSNALKINSRYHRARYNRALAYSALDQFDKAVGDYKKVIQYFDAHVKSHFNLGLLFYNHEMYMAAAEEFERTTALSSGAIKIKAFYFLGKSYTRISPQEKEKAVAAFNAAIRLDPAHIASRLALIDLEYSNDKRGKEKRLEALNTLLSLEPANVMIYRAIADLYHAMGNDALMLKSLKDALLNDPDNIDLQLEVATILMRTKKSQEAIAILEKILTIEPANTKAYFLLGRLYYLQGAYETALSTYNKVQSLNGESSPELWNNLGLLYSKMKRFGDAEDAYKKALLLRSDYPEAYYNLGLLLFKQDKFDKAIGFFEKAIQIRPDYHQAYYNLALAFSKQGDEVKAIEAYKKVLEISPQHISSKLNLAVRYSKAKEYKQAQKLYEEVLEQDSSYFTAWLNLGLVLYQQKEYGSAQDALEKAISLEPENDKAFRALAQNYGAMGMHDEAIEILERLLEQNPSDIRTRLAYARAYSRAKNSDAALIEYNKVLKLDPGNKIAKKMIERIESKKGQ